MKKRNYMFLLALAVVLFSCVTGERDEQSGKTLLLYWY